MSTAGYKILALESNVFNAEELVTSKNEICKESFTLLKFTEVELILQLKVVLLQLLLLLLFWHAVS